MNLPTRLLRLFGRVELPVAVECARLASKLRTLSPGTKTLLRWVGALLTFGLVIFLVSCLGGCHASSPAHIALPTAATVQAKVGAPAVAARTSNARAVQIAARAEKTGLAAGSADAHALTLATAETDQHLADVLAGKDALTAQLGSFQLKIDALERHDAAQTTLATREAATIIKLDHSRWIWRGLFVLSLALDFFFGASLEKYLRGAVTVVWRMIASGYHLVAGVLKAMFPLYTFWLPA